MFMTPKERKVDHLSGQNKPHSTGYNPKNPQNHNRAWQQYASTKNKGPTLGEKIKRLTAYFEKKRIARMRPEERELFSALTRSKERYTDLQRIVKKIKVEYAREITAWRRKRATKGSEYSEADRQMEEQSQKQWKDWLERHEDALPQIKQDYNTALNLWKGRKLLRKA